MISPVFSLLRRPRPAQRASSARERASFAALFAGLGAVMLVRLGFDQEATAASRQHAPSQNRSPHHSVDERPISSDPLATGWKGSRDVTTELAELARTDPVHAIELAEQRASSDSERYRYIVCVLRAWAQRDFGAAWYWASTNTARVTESGFPTLTELLLEEAVKLDAQKPIAVATAFAPPFAGSGSNVSSADEAVVALLRSGQVELAAATVERWAVELASSSGGSDSFERVAFALASVSPATAIAWLERLPAVEGRERAHAVVAGVWAGQDPMAAISWAESLTPRAIRDAARVAAFTRWAERDGEAAIQWIANHDTQPGADQMIVQWLNLARPALELPRAALAWAELIRDPSLRSNEIEQILYSWARRDAPAAISYLSENTTVRGACPQDR